MRNRPAVLPAIPLTPRIWWRELRVQWLLPLICLAAVVGIASLWPTADSITAATSTPEQFSDPGLLGQKQWTVGLKSGPKPIKSISKKHAPARFPNSYGATNATPSF